MLRIIKYLLCIVVLTGNLNSVHAEEFETLVVGINQPLDIKDNKYTSRAIQPAFFFDGKKWISLDKRLYANDDKLARTASGALSDQIPLKLFAKVAFQNEEIDIETWWLYPKDSVPTQIKGLSSKKVVWGCEGGWGISSTAEVNEYGPPQLALNQFLPLSHFEIVINTRDKTVLETTLNNTLKEKFLRLLKSNWEIDELNEVQNPKSKWHHSLEQPTPSIKEIKKKVHKLENIEITKADLPNDYRKLYHISAIRHYGKPLPNYAWENCHDATMVYSAYIKSDVDDGAFTILSHKADLQHCGEIWAPMADEWPEAIFQYYKQDYLILRWAGGESGGMLLKKLDNKTLKPSESLVSGANGGC
jgi:hypothetical protein